LILDSFSHACILDGTFLAAGIPGKGPEVRFFNHNSAKSLERILKTRERKNALVLVEGVYSLDGDRAHLKEFVEICDRYDAVLVVDDAHGTGTLGTRGTGILEADGLLGKVPIVVSTFSKSFGGIGGILLADESIIDLVKHNARSFLFSASLPVPIVAAASTILDMLEADGPALVRELHQKSDYMRGKLTQIGFDLGASNTHIMPVMCRDERKTLFMHVALLECGVLMVPITYPGVKIGEERLRVNVTRGHTQEDMDLALSLLESYGEAFFVLSGEDLGPMEEDAEDAPAATASAE
jgi:glycine C-acetyltransferase